MRSLELSSRLHSDFHYTFERETYASRPPKASLKFRAGSLSVTADPSPVSDQIYRRTGPL